MGLDSLTSGLRKTMEKVFMETVFRYKMEKVTGVSQYGLNRSKSYLTNLIAFFAKLTASLNCLS